tara:strand:+ start:6959 stop:7279 length:321 start_codon:yes stop_codon:yes gene_type:complete
MEKILKQLGLSINIVIVILLLVIIYYLYLINNSLSLERFGIGGQGISNIFDKLSKLVNYNNFYSENKCYPGCASCDGPGPYDCSSCVDGGPIENNDDRDGFGSCPL